MLGQEGGFELENAEGTEFFVRCLRVLLLKMGEFLPADQAD